ncbi:MAG: PEP-CTERM sorting domain-containing protein [Nostoc sp. NOS(2021)]|nr:PEP-CTERM sorting domain-containing protein [Nostoc sp. NOS(2021)]
MYQVLQLATFLKLGIKVYRLVHFQALATYHRLSLSTDEPPDLDNQFQTFVGVKNLFDQKNISFQAYTPYKFNFTAEASSTELKFGSVDRHAFLYLDNVSVKPVPEPSTIGGVAVTAGLLGIWVKKKKVIS